MKLDYCQTHRGAPVEDAALPCLAIRHDDGRRVTQREIWAEIERLREALCELLACHTESAGFTMSMLAERAEFDAMLQRGQERLEAAVAAARQALGA